MLVESVATFLGISILFYAVFAGADFGAGILELMLGREHRKDQRHVIDGAMGPVWEANHVWLILAVVILFNGFPRAYAQISTTFHIPLTIMLIGIILRGCAFTFRHYDAVRDRSQLYYLNVFRVASLITPFMLGVIAAGLATPARASVTFYDAYVARWCTPFAAALGLFTCTLFAFLAAVYLIGEPQEESSRAVFRTRARALNAVAVAVGALVFPCAAWSGVPLFSQFIEHPLALAGMALATLVQLPLWWSVATERWQMARVLAAAQVSFVLAGWFRLQFPVLLVGGPGAGDITVYNTAAAAPVLRVLLFALVGGCLLIFPALYFLLRVFKREAHAQPPSA